METINARYQRHSSCLATETIAKSPREREKKAIFEFFFCFFFSFPKIMEVQQGVESNSEQAPANQIPLLIFRLTNLVAFGAAVSSR